MAHKRSSLLSYFTRYAMQIFAFLTMFNNIFCRISICMLCEQPAVWMKHNGLFLFR